MGGIYRRCGAVLQWEVIGTILVWTEEFGYRAKCPGCGATKHQVAYPKFGQKCFALVRRK